MGCISYKINFHFQFQLLQIKCNFDHLKFIYLAGNFSSIVEDSHDLVQKAIEGLDHYKRISTKCFSKTRSLYCIKQIYLLFFGLRWQEALCCCYSRICTWRWLGNGNSLLEHWSCLFLQLTSLIP